MANYRRREPRPKTPSYKQAARNECGLVAYQSRADARRGRNHTPGEQLRAYQCDGCGLWHLGHTPDPVRSGDVSAARFFHREMAF